MFSYVNRFVKRYGKIIVVCGILLTLIGTVTAFVIFWPRSDQSFFELGLLGKDGKAEQYYRDNDPNINISSKMNWYVFVHNYMHAPQDVDLKVKLLNSTMLPPNDNLHLPSPFPSILEMPVHLDTDESLTLPFSWSVNAFKASTSRGNLIVINQLTINNMEKSVNVYSSSSLFRMVFELWVYNQTSKGYDFGWRYNNNYGSASIYMWFNMNLS